MTGNSLPIRKQPAKICILRLSALGDVTHTVPVVRAIQQHWPGTEITWICGKLEKKLLAELENVRFIQFDKKQGWRAYTDLYRQLKNESFDVLLHMQIALRANLASLFVRAPVRLGWDKARSRDFHRLFVNERVPEASQQHQVQGFLSFARRLGLPAQEPVWSFPVSVEGQAFAEQYVATDRKTLVISPCSSHPLRNWSAAGYAEVADYATGQLGMQVILSGGPGEPEIRMAREIEAQLTHPVTNLVGKDTLQQLVGLLNAADAVISPDSGPGHIANALGTPVIGLYACTWSRRSGPYSFLDCCIDKFNEAANTFRGRSAESMAWGSKIELAGVMDLIETREVIDKLDRLIASGRC